jgi:hypothetical protein
MEGTQDFVLFFRLFSHTFFLFATAATSPWTNFSCQDETRAEFSALEMAL